MTLPFVGVIVGENVEDAVDKSSVSDDTESGEDMRKGKSPKTCSDSGCMIWDLD